MKISNSGLTKLRAFEGCRLKAYKDPVGNWTIGYGVTNACYNLTGVWIDENTTITKETAIRWLEMLCNEKYGKTVMKYDSIYHWTQHEFDALVSFAYNIGDIKQLTADGTRTKKEIADKITAYCNMGGRYYQALYYRRALEKKTFLAPDFEVGKKYYFKYDMNVRLTPVSGKVLKVLKAGKYCKLQEVQVCNDGSIWIKGKTGWICARDPEKIYVKEVYAE